ncbi:MAG: PKD domain-containing protein [Candidatus Thermoplasmatota archaeon]|nr:PKD domain-containing protein [Candidatus Thermoplasmatota archaeon]
MSRRSHQLVAIALISLIMVIHVHGGEGERTGQEPAGEKDRWLLMIYMAADNTLGENGTYGNAAWMDLEELESVFPSSGVRALVLSDMKGDGNTVLFDIKNHPSPGLGSDRIPLSEVNSTWTDEIRSSDWRALRDFLVYSMNRSDAEHVMLVIWDHGSGWTAMQAGPDAPTRGFAQDVTDGGMMNLKGLRMALSEAEVALGSFGIDIITFDACSMGTVEVLHQVSDWALIGLAGEDEQPFYGLNYSFVAEMGGEGSLDPGELASSIVSSFASEYSNPEYYPYSTFAASNLTLMGSDLIDDLDALSMELWGWMYDIQALNDLQLEKVVKGVEGVASFQLDLGDLLLKISLSDLPGDIPVLAKAALETYNRTILAEYHVPGGRNPYATGMSIYFPHRSFYNPDYDGHTGYLTFTADTYWDEMLRERADPKERMRIVAEMVADDGDGIHDDLRIGMFDPSDGNLTPMEDVLVSIPGLPGSRTGPSGIVMFKDLAPGVHIIEAEKGLLRARSQMKVLNRAPMIIVNIDPDMIYEGIKAVIDASSSYDPDGDVLSFAWDLDEDDGLDYSDSTEPYVEMTWYDEGPRTLHLKVGDGLINTTAVVPIMVHNKPPSAFLRAPSAVMEDEVFTVDASESSDTVPDLFDLRYSFILDGSIVMDWGPSPVLNLSIPGSGSHTLSVSVRDPKGAVSNASAEILVFNEIPRIRITGPNTALEDEKVHFTSAAIDSPSDLPTLRYIWRHTRTWSVIGESDSLYVHFEKSGVHNISLEVIDDDEASSMAFHEIEIVNSPPIADLTMPDFAYEDQIIILNASASRDTPSDLASLIYEWDVGADGSIDGTGIVFSVSFSKPGKHTVKLIVTDDDGDLDIIERSVVIVNAVPVPKISGPASAIEDEVVPLSLMEGADTPSDDPILTVRWTLDGDPLEITGRDLNISFPGSGSYVISVIAIDDQGASGSSTHVMEIINLPPVSRLGQIPERVRVGQGVDLIGHLSSDTPSDNRSLTFRWMIDGAAVHEGKERNHTVFFERPGRYVVGLVVIDDDGEMSLSEERTILVEEESPKGIMGLITSHVFLFVMVLLLCAVIVSSLVMRRKVRRLPSPIDPGFEAPPVASGEELEAVTEDPSQDEGSPPNLPMPDEEGPTIAIEDPPELEPPQMGDPVIPAPIEIEPADPAILE